jgi:hypothetical protein
MMVLAFLPTVWLSITYGMNQQTMVFAMMIVSATEREDALQAKYALNVWT